MQKLKIEDIKSKIVSGFARTILSTQGKGILRENR